MTHPLAQLQQELDVEQRTFAIWLGVSPTLLNHTENGYFKGLPPKIQRGLRDRGMDADDFAERHKVWMAEQVEMAERIVERKMAR